VAERSAAIPPPQADDPDDVATALETANALWGIGDKQEGIRWLRRAADAAERAGDDLRAVGLARTAADLASELHSEATAAEGPAEAALPHSEPAVRRVSRPPPPPPPPPSARASHPPPLPSVPATSHPPPLPSAPATSPAPSSPSPALRPPPAPSASGSSAGPPPTASRRPPPPSALARPRSIPPPPEEPAAGPRPAKALAASGAAESEEGPDVWHALRVSIKRSARDPSLFVLRRLEDGKETPPGTRAALIVVMDSGADVLGTSSPRADRGKGPS
jgi:hypothetical protein